MLHLSQYFPADCLCPDSRKLPAPSLLSRNCLTVSWTISTLGPSARRRSQSPRTGLTHPWHSRIRFFPPKPPSSPPCDEGTFIPIPQKRSQGCPLLSPHKTLSHEDTTCRLAVGVSFPFPAGLFMGHDCRSSSHQRPRQTRA